MRPAFSSLGLRPPTAMAFPPIEVKEPPAVMADGPSTGRRRHASTLNATTVACAMHRRNLRETHEQGTRQPTPPGHGRCVARRHPMNSERMRRGPLS